MSNKKPLSLQAPTRRTSPAATAACQPASHEAGARPASPPAPPFQDTTALLRYLYSDVRRISDVASPDILLHPADRHVSASRAAYEDALVAATRGTLRMDVQSMIPNAHFGAVLGVLRATKQGCDDLAVSFCGVWRFVDSWAVGALGECGRPGRAREVAAAGAGREWSELRSGVIAL
ncbi:hypothetical protein B0T24DRAFT_678480 [Lasiosphaeria ovina]|uniref:Uncharacterized protein n=1 Tax=Lasiosphaeria ovina TaxID=92902 RepID=A0AAE0KAD8_9PEZI|nr:hypothetical protein B0T24DRAFT_678480 [Lasiosphaeria ovina]